MIYKKIYKYKICDKKTISIKLKNTLILYLTIFSALLLFLVGGGLVCGPILLGLFVSPYYFYLLIISVILLPLIFISIAKILLSFHF